MISSNPDEQQIETWRRRIDELDADIVELLNERSRCALAIGAIKRRLGRMIYDPAREAAIVAQVVGSNRGPLPDDAVRRLFERILDESRRMERVANASTGGAGDLEKE
ncbi:MAG TPA: chorismate mutase [Patescibacteria group bacterium]|nr:chorismate mutase [Patescibacteria group bacterium]